MASAASALLSAIHLRLTSDTALTAMLGGPHVWDHVPRGAAYPYVSIGSSTERDWAAGNEPGSEHILTLSVWSRAAGRRQADDIAYALRNLLHDQSLSLSGNRLVNLRHETTDLTRDARAETYRAVLRFRAVTEPL